MSLRYSYWGISVTLLKSGYFPFFEHYSDNRSYKAMAYLVWIASLFPRLIQLFRRIAIWVALPRFYLIGFIPCSAGLWTLGLYCWERPVQRKVPKVLLRLLSYLLLIVGTFLFIAGLWRFALILLVVRLLVWIDRWLDLGKPFASERWEGSTRVFSHPLDHISLCLIGFYFLVLATNKERLVNKLDPSDHFYHMAVAQQILDRGEIPIWDDWEFAPVGRPHLYPPFLHLLIAFFSRTSDNVITGFANIQILLYPFALFTHWYLFRYLLGPPMAYGSLIILSMEFMFGMGCLGGLPSSLVNSFLPMLLLAVLKKQKWMALALLALAHYTHTGMPITISLGLLVFGIWKREYFGLMVFVVLGALVASFPWTYRYVIWHDWMHSGGAQGFSLQAILQRLLWLQLLNPVFLILALWGWIQCKESKLTILKSQAIGFVPMLTQYGGRFFMHASPFLSPLIFWPLRRWVISPVTKRRALSLLLLTLIPLPCIRFFGIGGEHDIGFMPGITATHLAIYLTIDRTPPATNKYDIVIQTLKETTSPDEIIHLPDAMHHVGNYINVMARRRTDMGGWGEIYSVDMWMAIQKARNDPRQGTVVARDKDMIPDGYRVEECGEYFIGYSQLHE